jgi:hypothetical protein
MAAYAYGPDSVAVATGTGEDAPVEVLETTELIIAMLLELPPS